MPQRKKVESLVDQCLKCVASRTNYWMQVDQSELHKMSLCSLPSILLEKIIKILARSKQLTKQAFQHLITSQFRFLDVSHCENSAEMAHYLRLASLKCPKLTNLICHREYNTPTRRIVNKIRDPKILQTVYLMFLPRFEKLEVLILADSQQVGDECLCILGSFATKLIRLNVSKCCKVTDAGITGLCVSFDESGNEVEKVGQCKLIEHLDIKETSLTERGVKMALENLPNLKELNCDHSLIEILTEMHQEACEQKKKIPSYSLTMLDNADMKDVPYHTGSLRIALSLICPSSIKRLVLCTDEGLTDDELPVLSALTMLEDLTIASTGDVYLTFGGGVYPLLKAIGNSLDALHLQGLMDEVDIYAIIEFCPNLKKLVFFLNPVYSTAKFGTGHNPKRRRTEHTILQNLETLSITDIFSIEFSEYQSGEFPHESLLLLLSSPSLKKISVNNCDTLTDDILSQAVHLHGFTRLKSLKILGCPNVTNRGIDLFMNETNPLRRIVYSQRTQREREIAPSPITLKDIEDWKLKAEEENWELEIN